MGTVKSKAHFDLAAVISRVGERISEIGTNESAVSDASGLSSSYLRNLRRGVEGKLKVVSPRVDALAAVARTLGLSFGWLVTGKGARLASDESDDFYEAIEKLEKASQKVRRRTVHFLNTIEDD